MTVSTANWIDKECVRIATRLYEKAIKAEFYYKEDAACLWGLASAITHALMECHLGKEYHRKLECLKEEALKYGVGDIAVLEEQADITAANAAECADLGIDIKQPIFSASNNNCGDFEVTLNC